MYMNTSKYMHTCVIRLSLGDYQHNYLQIWNIPVTQTTTTTLIKTGKAIINPATRTIYMPSWCFSSSRWKKEKKKITKTKRWQKLCVFLKNPTSDDNCKATGYKVITTYRRAFHCGYLFEQETLRHSFAPFVCYSSTILFWKVAHSFSFKQWWAKTNYL